MPVAVGCAVMTVTTRFDDFEQRSRELRARVVGRVQGSSLMLLLGAATGLATGLLAAALIEVTDLVSHYAFPLAADGFIPSWAIVVVPAIGAAIAGLFIMRVPEVGGSGVVTVMRSIALRGGRFTAEVPPAGVMATGIALGTGSSGGREAPIALIGGSMGSLFGRLFVVGEERMRSLVAAGVAAGIGASFNAPIGGMIFAVEFIVGGFRTRSSVQTVVVSSVVGSTVARVIIGPDITFRPDVVHTLEDPRELLLYALLGFVAVGASVAFVRTEGVAVRAFARIAAPLPVRLGLAGLGVGLIALMVPEVLGAGEHLPEIRGLREPIVALLNGEGADDLNALPMLLSLLGAKMLATALSAGSGNAVGTFAPTLFMGAALGSAFGVVAQAIFPGTEPGAFALVGMAAMFAATARGPLTATILAFEITGDYGMILPLMLATGVATIVADRLKTDGSYLASLRREGIVYSEPDDVDIMQTVQVGEVMTRRVETVDAGLDAEGLRRLFVETGHHGFPVVDDEGRLFGVVTRSDLARTSQEVSEDLRVSALTVADICTRQPVTVTPTDPVFRAIRRMASLDVGRLPVVDPTDHGVIVGILRRPDLVRAYQRAVTRSAGSQQRRDRSRLRDLAGVQFVELVIEPGAPVDGLEVRQVSWPERTVITSIRRRGDTVVPSGATLLHAGDELVALTGNDGDALVALVTGTST